MNLINVTIIIAGIIMGNTTLKLNFIPIAPSTAAASSNSYGKD